MYINRKGIQFSSKDTWSLDDTLSPIIASGLRKFISIKELNSNHFGIPGSILSDINESGEYTEEELMAADKEWSEILEDILYAFENYEMSLMFQMPKEAIRDNISFDKNTIMRTPNPLFSKEAYDAFHAKEAKHIERRQKGLDYFVKHLSDLWW